tara:strand:+ start:203 stop:1231 length:1029 start_codon:yes stop_codon:yes gene_type:complete
MNIIIVGFGTAGKFYLNLLNKFKFKKNISILESEKIQNKPKNVSIYYKIDEIKKKKLKFNFAIIATPSHLHFKFAQFFIKQKTNVLIEKPMVLKLDHAKKLIFLSNKYKIKCWVSFQNRYNKAISKLKKAINSNKIGKISLIDCVLLWKRDHKYYKTSWRGRYKTDGGVLANQAIHLLDCLIYVFGPIKNFNVLAGYNKKKLEAEDIIAINFLHNKNNIISSFKATTRADNDYRSALDIIGERGRFLVKGISLNTFSYFKKGIPIYDKKNSENFNLGLGPISGMGNGHYKILKEFFNKRKKSSKNLEINKNYYLLKVMHSVYNGINKNKLNKVMNKQSIWGR